MQDQEQEDRRPIRNMIPKMPKLAKNAIDKKSDNLNNQLLEKKKPS